LDDRTGEQLALTGRIGWRLTVTEVRASKPNVKVVSGAASAARIRSTLSAELLQREFDLPLDRFVDFQHEGLLIVGDGPVILSDKPERIAPVFECDGVIRIEPDGFVKVANGAIVLSHFRV
jgi:hypothetical protein